MVKVPKSWSDTSRWPRIGLRLKTRDGRTMRLSKKSLLSYVGLSGRTSTGSSDDEGRTPADVRYWVVVFRPQDNTLVEQREWTDAAAAHECFHSLEWEL